MAAGCGGNSAAGRTAPNVRVQTTPTAARGLRDDETVAGVGVTGAGTCGAMLHGHVGVATGRCEDEGPGAE